MSRAIDSISPPPSPPGVKTKLTASSSPNCLGCGKYHGGVVVHIKCLEKTILEQRDTIQEMLAEIAERNRKR